MIRTIRDDELLLAPISKKDEMDVQRENEALNKYPGDRVKQIEFSADDSVRSDSLNDCQIATSSDVALLDAVTALEFEQFCGTWKNYLSRRKDTSH